MPNWKRRYEDEFGIVDRVWLALGIRKYEDANGKSVDQIVAETVAESARLRADLDEATDALKTADSWLEGWAQHVGRCRGGAQCECGLEAVRYEVRAFLSRMNSQEGSDG